MEYSFTAWGHENVTGKHKRTLEFTKDTSLTLQGDCILGVNSNFSLYDLRELIKESKKLKMIIKVGDVSDEVVFEANPQFDDEQEIVVRMGEFSSDRTFGINADKSCAYLKRELVDKMKSSDAQIEVLIITLE